MGDTNGSRVAYRESTLTRSETGDLGRPTELVVATYRLLGFRTDSWYVREIL